MSTDTTEFVAKSARLKGSLTGALSGTFSPGDMAEEILGDVNYGELMAYCYRRFGPPNIGSDPYKGLADWVITTPMDGLFLGISVRPHDTSLLFGYWLEKELDRQLNCVRRDRDNEERDRWAQWCMDNKGEQPPMWARWAPGSTIRYGTPEYEELDRRTNLYRAEYEAGDAASAPLTTDISLLTQAEDAMKAALADLKRPVRVRDVDMNVFGRCEGGDDSVEYFHAAGYYVPPHLLDDPEAWCELLAAIGVLGDDATAVRRAAEAIRASFALKEQEK